MENSIYIGLSRQMTLRDNMDVIANNVANMNTAGYRGQNLLFREYLSDPRGADDPLSFVFDQGMYENTAAGPVKKTENPFDVYLDGPGFLGVLGPEGKTFYTRAGNLQMKADGTLVTSAGDPVSSAGGAPINIPAGSTEISIDEKGFVSNQDGQVGQLKITEFENPQTLAAYGNNLYQTDETGAPAVKTRTRQYQLEGSNVQPVIEMTRMIDTLRSFQSVQQILQSENERLRGAIRALTRNS